MKIPKLKASESAGEGSVVMPDDWDRHYPMLKADLLSDWIADLQTEYEKTMSELFPSRGTNDNVPH